MLLAPTAAAPDALRPTPTHCVGLGRIDRAGTQVRVSLPQGVRVVVVSRPDGARRGFHRLGPAVFVDNNVTGMGPIADRLVTDVGKLRTFVKTQTYGSGYVRYTTVTDAERRALSLVVDVPAESV
jgi:iron uptake system EfeUOB component EfeO/EfeM